MESSQKNQHFQLLCFLLRPSGRGGGANASTLASTREVGFNGKATTGVGEYIAMLDVQQRTRDTATCGVESYMEKITGTEAVSMLLAL